jgi:ABC-type nitrate/sulfonate/bicarbonate transport system substrate-binding protein
VKFPGFRWTTAACAACALAVGALAAGCSTAATAAPAAAPPEQSDISVDVFPAVDFAGLSIAQVDGLFKRQGLNVTIRFAPTGQTSTRA